MKKYIFILISLIVISLPIKAQSSDVQRLSDAVTQIVGSFMDNPYHHDNTIKIYNLTQTFKKTIDEVYNSAIAYSISLVSTKND